MRQTVTSTWEVQSGARFYGWTTCKTFPGAVRISIADDANANRWMARRLRGLVAG